MLADVCGWNNHRPLLLWALDHSSSLPILEMGCGDGSTPYLQQAAKELGRKLYSYDSDKAWADKFNAVHVIDWDSVKHDNYSVILIDHAPGERRYIDIAKLKDSCEYMVIHDTEPEATGYMLDRIWHLFPYRRDLKSSSAWASIVSTKKFIPESSIVWGELL